MGHIVLYGRDLNFGTIFDCTKSKPTYNTVVRMDRELPAEVIRKSKFKKFGVMATILIVLLISYYAFRALVTPALDRNKIRTSIAEWGVIER